jgi:hypothetical protein
VALLSSLHASSERRLHPVQILAPISLKAILSLKESNFVLGPVPRLLYRCCTYRCSNGESSIVRGVHLERLHGTAQAGPSCITDECRACLCRIQYFRIIGVEATTKNKSKNVCGSSCRALLIQTCSHAGINAGDECSSLEIPSWFLLCKQF